MPRPDRMNKDPPRLAALSRLAGGDDSHRPRSQSNPTEHITDRLTPFGRAGCMVGFLDRVSRETAAAMPTYRIHDAAAERRNGASPVID
jgi:hypothetical protein